MTEPVPWQAIDDTIFAWLDTKLAMGGRIIWKNRKVDQPAYPYLSLLRTSVEDQGGRSELRYQGLDAVGDPTEDPNLIDDIKVTATEQITFLLTIMAHTDLGNGMESGDTDALSLVETAKRGIGLPSVDALFSAANIAVVTEGAATDVSVAFNGEWINQASLDVTFRATSAMSESAGLIEKVELKSPPLGIDFLVDAS